MKYLMVYLWSSPSIRIIDLMKSFTGGFTITSIKNCKLEISTYADMICKKDVNFEFNKHYDPNEMGEILVTVTNHLSYISFQTTTGKRMIILYYLPQQVINLPFNYHTWVWNRDQPGLILMPNINNDEQYYLPIKFKPLLVVPEKKIKYYKINDPNQLYINPEITYKFALSNNDYPPITIYDSNKSDKKVICGQTQNTENKYLHTSDILDFKRTYYITCNDVISYKTMPIIRLLINIFKGGQFIYSDYIIYRIAPIILMPNNLSAQKVYLASFTGIQNNQDFLIEVKNALEKSRHECVIVDNPNISMYHRWMQDIFKFGYCTDGHRTQYIVLKGPHFLAKTSNTTDISYIYTYFKNLPMYSFDFSSDKNLDAFGNVQIIPPMEPNYPLGRIIYGISDDNVQSNISYNLMAFLENQQVQKPIRVNTGWLSVGHVDEILSYIPDVNHRLGFRILIASPNKFYQIIKNLKSDQLIFNNKDIYYIFEQSNTNNVPYSHKYNNDNKYQCIYNTQVKTKDLLNWSDLISINQYYQSKLDDIKVNINERTGFAR